MNLSFLGQGAFYATEQFIYALWPIWLPVILGAIFWDLWMRYIRAAYIAKQGSVLLEIKLPIEMLKSPLAMEVFLIAFWHVSTPSFIETYYQGKIRPWFSLELVSLGGEVKFYIWCWKSYKPWIETQAYAQFPNIEIYEVEDYTLPVRLDPEKTPVFGIQYKLFKADAYPIRSYVDYGLDKDPKEEFKVDPITPILEFLGSMKKDEQMWIQIIVRGHRKEGFNDGFFFTVPDWRDAAKKEIEDIRKKLELNSLGQIRRATKGEEETINAIERNIYKHGFDCAIRAIYTAPKAVYSGSRPGHMKGLFAHHGSGTLNSVVKAWTPEYDYPWEDYRRLRVTRDERDALDAYKHRSFFFHPHRHFHAKPFVLSAESLATLYHFPGGVAMTPTIVKSVSKKGEAPPNLPV